MWPWIVAAAGGVVLFVGVAVGIESARLAQQQQDQFIQTLTTLARTVDARDRGTATHAQRVTE